MVQSESDPVVVSENLPENEAFAFQIKATNNIGSVETSPIPICEFIYNHSTIRFSLIIILLLYT